MLNICVGFRILLAFPQPGTSLVVYPFLNLGSEKRIDVAIHRVAANHGKWT